MNRPRLLSAVVAALTVLGVAGAVTTPGAAATTRPAAPSSARAYQVTHGVKITWVDPRSAYDSLAVRYRRGTAPTRTQGKKVTVGKHATSATLTGLKPGAAYTASIWTVKGKGQYSARTTVAFIAPRTPAAVVVGKGTLHGIVKDGGGHPLKGVRVYITGENAKTGREIATPASGAYSASLPAGLYDVYTDAHRATGGSADATGYLSDEIEAQVHAKSSTTRNLTLPAGGAITGRVLDRSGAPLEGIVVYTQSVQPVASTETADGIVYGGGGLAYTLTGTDGSYKLKGVSDVASQLCFSSANFDTGAPGPYADTCKDGSVATAATTIKGAGETTLQPASSGTGAPSGSGTLKIAVTTSTGKQVDHAEIFVLGFTGHSGYGQDVTADATGHAVVTGLPAGQVQVCAAVTSRSTKARSATGFRPLCKSTRTAAKKTTSVSVVLPLGAAISGTVVGPHGALPGVGIDISSSSETDPFRAQGVVVASSDDGEGGIPTNSVGRYKVTALPAGQYKVCAEAGGVRSSAPTGTLAACRAKKESATAGDTRILDLAVKTASAVAGTVRAAAGPLPENAELAVYTSGGDIGQYTPSGTFDLGGLKAGSHRVCAGAFYILSGVVASACRTAVSKIGHTSTLNLTLPAAGTVDASATYSDGQPVTGADAVLLKACPHDDGEGIYGCGPIDAFSKTRNVEVVASANTFADGTVPLDGVAPGKYALCLLGFNAATAGADLPASGVSDTCTSDFSVTVTKGQTTNAGLTLTQAAAVSGTVTGPDGKGVAGVRVEVSGEAITPDQDEYDFSDDPSSDYAITAADGSYSVRSITPGVQTVCFDASQAGTAKSGFQDQCVGGAAGGSGDGTPIVLLPGANGPVDQMLASGPGRNQDAMRHASTHRTSARAGMNVALLHGARLPLVDRSATQLAAGLRSVHDGRSATTWWRTAGTRFAALPAIMRVALLH